MKLREISFLPFRVMKPPRPSEALSKLALFHICQNSEVTLSILLDYVRKYGKYWFDSLREDALLVLDEVPSENREEEMFVESLNEAIVKLRPKMDEAFEIFPLISVARYPELGAGRRELLSLSYEVHVRKSHKRVVKEVALPCLVSRLT
jgi:hypothetical protein